jgi:hypothetical protein
MYSYVPGRRHAPFHDPTTPYIVMYACCQVRELCTALFLVTVGYVAGARDLDVTETISHDDSNIGIPSTSTESPSTRLDHSKPM